MSAFHDGELALQAETGVRERLAQAGPRVIRDHMPDQHREFFVQLPYVVVGTLDESGQPHASLLAGPPGFARSPEPTRLRIDAVLPHARAGSPVGLLGIEAHTRRRNRMNGVVAAIDASGVDIDVRQSFGNCPKYIQPREAFHDPKASTAATVRAMAQLDGQAARLVWEADTFFIATAHPLARAGGDPSHGVDVSHRGGPAGFVEVDAAGTVLSLPDFAGNSFFNTFGNLLLEPRCSLLFVDFATAAQLQLTARGEVVRDPSRRLLLHVESARLTAGGLPLRWR